MNGEDLTVKIKKAKACYVVMAALVASLGGLNAASVHAQELAFQLTDLDGHTVRLEKREQHHFTVVCFLGTECPLAKLYASRLSRLSEEFESIDMVGIFSNRQDSREDIVRYRENHAASFPLLIDPNNQVADQFGATRTPEVFLIDNELKVRYRGRIDDQYLPGIAKAEPQRDDLRLAIQECLAGKVVSVPTTQPAGCLIGRIKKKTEGQHEVTFANQISRIIQNHCFECHRQGEIGPMELVDYDEIVGWADMILEVVEEGRMPPWHADPAHGTFANERRMTEAEKEMLRLWVEAGTPMGDQKQLPQFEATAKSTEWRLPKAPDKIFNMWKEPIVIPATGTLDYRYFVIDPEFDEDKWVTAAQVLPGDHGVVHHSIVFVRPPDGDSLEGIGWLAAYVPGQGSPAFNPKYGRRIPAGSTLVFQQHYTPNGKETTDMTRLGLVFGDEEEIENELITLLAMDQEFVIPPGDPNHEVNAQFSWLPAQGVLLGFAPHMHYRGKSFSMTAEYGDAKRTLLDVPKYDFNWQHYYQLKEPIPLSKIRSIDFVASFDNSTGNPNNPDPSAAVTWGEQTSEEMAIVYATASLPRGATREAIARTLTKEEQENLAKEKAARAKRVERFVDEFFERFDTNRDGVVKRTELPRSTRTFGAWHIDHDGDGNVTRKEVTSAANWRFRNK